MDSLNGLKLAVCQMPVVPGRPDLNVDYMVDEIQQAAQRGVGVIIFPELCVSGYLIGDLFEDESFIKDVAMQNERIRLATDVGISAVFGSVLVDPGKIGEDGRLRMHNSAFIAANGDWVGMGIKTLQPNYRIFDDDRHFYSLRKVREEDGEKTHDLDGRPEKMSEYLFPFNLPTRLRDIKLGVIICEDMWRQDYPYNPTATLVQNGAELIVNLSASPWSWQKNRKRHQVVKDLLKASPVPFVYVNNTGIQNTGKNIVVFDGSSTIYRADGEIVFEVAPYQSGSSDFIFGEAPAPIERSEANDTAELFAALHCAAKGFFETLPQSMRRVVIGLSGGIDSAVSAALLTYVLGPENVTAINMPSRYNSEATKSIAQRIASNLGIKYEVRSIQPIVDAIATATGVEEDCLAYENIQARARMEILAAIAQKNGGVFVANWNKVEAAFGYGTLYGDMAGFFAPLGDLVKREVYQIGAYLNQLFLEPYQSHVPMDREDFSREVIPRECFEIAPSAELKNDQRDPFDYGKLEWRGYHDEMVRAFTEFRRNPEWFLERYLQKKLEGELKLEEGTLDRLFLSGADFVADLEKNWQRYCSAYFKRVQGAPIPLVSKRAFGTDLRESILSPHLTQRYKDLKKLIIKQVPKQERIVIFGGSFNPPCLHHRQIAEKLAESFDRVIVVPCGRRPDKVSVDAVTNEQREAMTLLAFKEIARVEVDCFDLENGSYTPTYRLEEHFREIFPEDSLWHVVGGDLIIGGHEARSEIQLAWHRGPEIWRRLNFVVVIRPGYDFSPEDLPESAKAIEIVGIFGSGTMARERVGRGEPIDGLVLPAVAKYIEMNNLYRM